MSADDQRAAAVERAMKLQAGTVLAREVSRLRARVAELEAAQEAQSEALRDEGSRSRAYEQEAYDAWCAAEAGR